jgi:ABC-type spermidine/putrescine transport system permease subunit I
LVSCLWPVQPGRLDDRKVAILTAIRHRKRNRSSFASPATCFPRDVQLLYTPGAVLIALVYTYLPFVILPVYGSVEKLDVSLLEAAADLGAGPWRAFLRVILPLTMPGVVAGVLLVFVPSVAMFAVTSVMGGGRVLLIGDVIQVVWEGRSRTAPTYSDRERLVR